MEKKILLCAGAQICCGEDKKNVKKTVTSINCYCGTFNTDCNRYAPLL